MSCRIEKILDDVGLVWYSKKTEKKLEEIMSDQNVEYIVGKERMLQEGAKKLYTEEKMRLKHIFGDQGHLRIADSEKFVKKIKSEKTILNLPIEITSKIEILYREPGRVYIRSIRAESEIEHFVGKGRSADILNKEIQGYNLRKLFDLKQVDSEAKDVLREVLYKGMREIISEERRILSFIEKEIGEEIIKIREKSDGWSVSNA